MCHEAEQNFFVVYLRFLKLSWRFWFAIEFGSFVKCQLATLQSELPLSHCDG